MADAEENLRRALGRIIAGALDAHLTGDPQALADISTLAAAALRGERIAPLPPAEEITAEGITGDRLLKEFR
jgi:hypothetical protein